MHLSQERLQNRRTGGNITLDAAFGVHLDLKNQNFQVETQP
jgi:hypothetical protein